MAVAHRLHEAVWPAWLEAGRRPSDKTRREGLLRALAAVDAEPVRAWTDPGMLVDPVDETVSHAMYWQPPQGEEALTADPAVTDVLRPVAAAVAAAPATAWWTSGVDLNLLRYTSWPGQEAAPGPLVTGARERLNRWRDETLADERDAARNRPADPAAPFSGRWWSTPAMAALVTTTRPLRGLGSVELVWDEDSLGPRDASVWTLAPAQPPRVWEIDGPEAWVRLVGRYPLDVTSSRRHDWYRTTGRAGAWRIPDWAAVAADWDAVHLSVGGYLTAATRPLAVGDGKAATVLAGWNPDQTWWLTDVLTAHPAPETWRPGQDAGGPGQPAWLRS